MEESIILAWSPSSAVAFPHTITSALAFKTNMLNTGPNFLSSLHSVLEKYEFLWKGDSVNVANML